MLLKTNKDPALFAGDVILYALDDDGTKVMVSDGYDLPIGRVLWEGLSTADLHNGWALCDGTSYNVPAGTLTTPNLTDRFIKSNSTFTTGGAKTHTHPAHTIAVHSPGDQTAHTIASFGSTFDPGNHTAGEIGNHTAANIGNHTAAQVNALTNSHTTADVKDAIDVHTDTAIAAAIADHSMADVAAIIADHSTTQGTLNSGVVEFLREPPAAPQHEAIAPNGVGPLEHAGKAGDNDLAHSGTASPDNDLAHSGTGNLVHSELSHSELSHSTYAGAHTHSGSTLTHSELSHAAGTGVGLSHAAMDHEPESYTLAAIMRVR